MTYGEMIRSSTDDTQAAEIMGGILYEVILTAFDANKLMKPEQIESEREKLTESIMQFLGTEAD